MLSHVFSCSQRLRLKQTSDPGDRRQTISELQPAAQGVFWILDLLTYGFEQLTNSHSACAVGDEGWDHSARVGENGVSCACVDLAIRFEQPSTIANFYSDNAFLFSRAQFISRLPSTEICKSVWTRPRLLPDTQSVIAVLANFWRQP